MPSGKFGRPFAVVLVQVKTRWRKFSNNYFNELFFSPQAAWRVQSAFQKSVFLLFPLPSFNSFLPYFFDG